MTNLKIRRSNELLNRLRLCKDLLCHRRVLDALMRRFPLLARPAVGLITRPSRRHIQHVSDNVKTSSDSPNVSHYSLTPDELNLNNNTALPSSGATTSVNAYDITADSGENQPSCIGILVTDVSNVDHLIASTSSLAPAHDSETAPAMSVSARLRARRGLSQPCVHSSSSLPSPPSLDNAVSTSVGKLRQFGEVDPEARTARRRARRLLKKTQQREQEEARREQLAQTRLEKKKTAKRTAVKDRRSRLVKAARAPADGGEMIPDGNLLVDSSDMALGDTSQVARTVTPEGQPESTDHVVKLTYT
jgi:hypothetical protein